MRKLLLSLVIFGTIAAVPVCAAPAVQPMATAVAELDLSAVQPAQYYSNRREIRRREEFRRRQEQRRRRAARRAYRRGY